MPKKGDLLTFREQVKKTRIVSHDQTFTYRDITAIIYLEEFRIEFTNDFKPLYYKCFCVNSSKIEFIEDFNSEKFNETQ